MWSFVISEFKLCTVVLQTSTDFKIRLLVHQSQAGCIIGKGGYKIKELREVADSLLLVISNACIFPSLLLDCICLK